MEIIKKLFKLIRNHKWKKFIKLINSTTNINLNVQDEHKNYLLTYAIKYNKPHIVSILINKGCRCDIMDKNNRSIIYEAIIYNYVDIVKLLINPPDTLFGIPVEYIYDKHLNIPLHYAITAKNIEIISILHNVRPGLVHVRDENNYTALHIAVLTGSLDVVKCILQYMNIYTSDINIISKKYESALHLAINAGYNSISKCLIDNKINLDVQDYDDMTALHRAVILNNIELVKYILEHGCNLDIQDKYGNTALHCAIRKSRKLCFDHIILYEQNYNLWNIDGNTAGHIIFNEYSKKKKYYIDAIIGKISLTLQNNKGYTIMHYLMIHDIWSDYIDILKTKKIMIFSKNENDTAVIDYIYNTQNIKKYKLFIDIIVSSYIFQLKKNTNWKNNFDVMCSKELKDLTTQDKKYLFNDSDLTDTELNNKCQNIIHNKIINKINKYYDTSNDKHLISYPSTSTYDICIKEGKHIFLCTFIGSLLDILIGLLYLLKKHKNACAILKKTHSSDYKLCEFFKNKGIIIQYTGKSCEYLFYEILWYNYKLYMIDDFYELLTRCIDSGTQFIIIPLGIILQNSAHANYLIYDTSKKEVERFEPHGGAVPIGFHYKSNLLDTVLFNYFKDIDADIKYIRPNNFIPKIGFQSIEANENYNLCIGDPDGFCAVWCIWYVDQRLSYPHHDRQKLIHALISNIKLQRISYRNMIRNYSKNIIKERDKILNAVGININDWMNNNYTVSMNDKLIDHLMSSIKSVLRKKITVPSS